MALVKHQIECTACEHEGYVVSDESVAPPNFCPQCGENLNEQDQEQVYE